MEHLAGKRGKTPGMIWVLVVLASWTLAGAAEQKGQPDETASVTFSLGEAVICREIENREPVGQGDTFEKSVGRLYCFTRITGVSRDSVIHHIWYPPDRKLHDQSLPVKPPSWRTWSSKSIPSDWTGQWHVEIASADGTVLKTLVFEVK